MRLRLFYEKSSMPADELPCDPQAVIIKDGQLDKDGFGLSGQNEQWLRQILNEKKAAVKDVFLLTADKNGTYNFIAKQK
jgi:uncharacterized membrane protein YcaP (DUF421 family)